MDQSDVLRRQFGAMLESARKAQNMTQPALGAAVGVNVKLIRNWEAGRNMPSWEYLRKLHLTLGLSGEQLLLVERPSGAETLPPLAWQAARAELETVSELATELQKHLTRTRNVLGGPADPDAFANVHGPWRGPSIGTG